MTATERNELKVIADQVGALTNRVGDLANAMSNMTEKVSDLLEGRTANCATESMRIKALEDFKSGHETTTENERRRVDDQFRQLWSRLWQIALLAAGTGAIVTHIVSRYWKG